MHIESEVHYTRMYVCVMVFLSLCFQVPCLVLFWMHLTLQSEKQLIITHLVFPIGPSCRFSWKILFLVNFKEKFPVIDYVRNVHCPIVIFHGEKDMIIPYHLGYNVFLNALKYGRSSNVSFHSCGSTTHKKNYLSQIFHSTLDSIAAL